MNALKITRWLTIATAVAVLTAAKGLAQSPDPARAETAWRRAVAAEAEAALTGTGGERAWQEVIRLYLESANARAYNDPVAVTSMRLAAGFLSHFDRTKSAELYANAAQRALAMGDIVRAANSYLDAAAVLTETQDYHVSVEEFSRVERWVIQASMLAESPLLSDTERALILRRVAPVDIGNFAG